MNGAVELIPGPLGIFSETSEQENVDVYDQLQAIILKIGPGERAVLLRLAERLLLGQTTYGPLSIVDDRRSWVKEAGEEAADLLVYLAIDQVAKTIAKGTP